MSEPGAVLTVHDRAAPQLVSDCMAVMDAAFDPAFGEAWTASQLGSMLDMPGAYVVLACRDQQPAGFALLRAIAGEAELLLIAVRPCFRGLGIGRAILSQCIAQSKSCNCETIFLEVREGNAAEKLYRDAQFVYYNKRPNYYLGRDGVSRAALSFRRRIT